MDLHKKYSLVKEHPTHFEIHDMTDGKRFPIAKKDLHPASQIKLMKMQMFSGESDDPEDQVVQPDEPETVNVSEPQMAAPQAFDPVAAVPNFMPAPQAPVAAPGWQAPMLPQGQGPGDAGVQAQAAAPANPQALVGPGMAEQLKGIQGQAASAGQMAHDQQIALEAHQRSAEKLAQDHAMNIATLDAEQAGYQKKIMDGEIKPQRYFEKMGTGQRISTAIGLILGGIGAGLTHGPNLAMQVMNKAVDDDIMAQKHDLGKVNTLLSMNLQKYHRLDSAEAATRLQYNTVLQTQLQAAASKATNGVAQAALHMQMGQLEQQNYAFKQTIALNQAKAQNLGFGGGEGGTPEGQENYQMLNDPKYQEKRVVVNGRAYQAADKTDAEKLRRTESIAGPVASQIHQLQELAKSASTRIAGSENNLKAKGIMGDLAVKLPQLTGLTRVNEVEIKHLLDTFQNPTRMDEALGKAKSVNFLKNMEEDLESKRSASLIGYKGAGSIKSFTPAEGKIPLNRK